MNETFDIPVTYKGSELILRAKLLIIGYTHKIQVEVNGNEIFFEPDEERNYRAVLVDLEQERAAHADKNLLKAIAQAIESILR